MVILKELYDTGKKMSVDKIMKNTRFSLSQVHNALKDLERRKLIKKEKVYGDASYKVPPRNKIMVEVNDDVVPRIKSLLEKAENAV